MAHDREVMGLNPGTVYWMDVSNASYYIKRKFENKGSQMGHTKKLKKKFWRDPFGYLYFRVFTYVIASLTSIQYTVPGFEPTIS